MQELFLFAERHWTLSLSCAVLLLLIIIVEVLRGKRAAHQLSPSQLTQMINHQNAAIVDLRPAEVFSKGHIIGALSLPQSQLKDNLKKMDKFKGRPIVLVCAKGQESPKIAAILKKSGYKVHVLQGGVASWAGADMPLIKD